MSNFSDNQNRFDRKNAGQSDGNSDRGRPVLIAVDLGAESCRISLLRWVDSTPEIQLVHRFATSTRTDRNGLRWNLEAILHGIEQGLHACAQLAPEGIAAIGVDGWAVDYVRLVGGKPTGDPFCYRDERTVEATKAVHARISPARLYELTGVQILALNTLYQLHADPLREQSLPWVNVPEYVMYWLGGRRVSEYTNATHTQLLAPIPGGHDHVWSSEIFAAAGLDINAAPPLVMPGTFIGRLRGSLASLTPFRETQLIASACHDTASAIAGIAANAEDWGFISSGTWSLVGCVLDSPCISEAARIANFSNQGGVGGQIYFLKNVNGMWLLRNCIEQWRVQGNVWTVEQLVAACADLDAPHCLIDVDEPDLLLLGDMPARINAQLRRRGQDPISDDPEMPVRMVNLIFHSLAERYAVVLRDASRITGMKIRRLYIVGGGSRNELLTRLTARTTGLEVLTGSTESTTLGNFAIQLAALNGEYLDGIGVSASAVTKWANILAAHPIKEVGGQAVRIGEAF